MHNSKLMTIRGLAVITFMMVETHALANTVLCGQYENVTDVSRIYTFNTNVWGQDESGSSCIEVLKNASALSTTWSWKANDTLVHAYPNINFNPVQRDPIPMNNLSSLDVRVTWSMKLGSGLSSRSSDADTLGSVGAKANVAFDMFFDTDITNATSTTAPKFEVMVWIGTYGSIRPLGASSNSKKLPRLRVGGEEFTLYQGPNNNGQHVFSWVAGSNQTTFESDISPLVHYLWRHGFVLATNYIGVIQFGTEQKHATSNVTFKVDNFAISAMRGTPKAAAGRSSIDLFSMRYMFIVVASVLFVLI